MQFKGFASSEVQRLDMGRCPRDGILSPGATLADAPLPLRQLRAAPGIPDHLKHFFPWKTSALPALWENKNAQLDRAEIFLNTFP